MVGALVLLVLRPLQLLVLRLLELVALRLLQLLVLRFLVLVALRLLWCYGPTVFGAMLLAKYSTAVAGGFFIGYELGGRKSSKRSGNMSCNIKRTCSIALHYVCLLLCCVSIYAAQYSTVFVLRYVHTYNVRSTIYITATAYCIRCGLYCAV